MLLWGVFSVLLFVPPPDAGAAATAVCDFIVRHAGFEVMAVSMAALAIVCRSIGITGAWMRAAHSRTPARIGFREALRSTIADGPFRVLLPTVVLFAVAFELLQGSIPFYVHAAVGKHTWVTPGILLGVAIGSAVVCVPLFVRLGERSSKRDAYRHSMLAAALAFPVLGIAGLLPFVPAELQILGAAALVGAPIGAHFLFPVPLTADVIDEDSRETSHRREATYLGASSCVERTATSAAPLLLVLLRLLGDTRGHALGVRLVGPVGGAIILAGWLRFRSYRLEDEVVGRVEPEAAETGELEAVVSPT
jgi:Na+/melibiose symporter-like transporter